MASFEQVIDIVLDQILGPLLEKAYSQNQPPEEKYTLHHTAEETGETIPLHCQRLAMLTRRMYHMQKDLIVVEAAHHEAPESCIWILKDITSQAYELTTECSQLIHELENYQNELHDIRAENARRHEKMKEKQEAVFKQFFAKTTPPEQKGDVHPADVFEPDDETDDAAENGMHEPVTARNERDNS